jgi:hypothetical protein
MTLDAHEFIRGFLLHVIPKGFVRVRHFGFLANRSKSPSVKVPSTSKPQSHCAQAPPALSSGADAPTHRHRYLSMPCLPTRNSDLCCQPARPCPMGFFVMIAQRPKAWLRRTARHWRHWTKQRRCWKSTVIRSRRSKMARKKVPGF